jgi:PAS domain S-box-containing protein
MKNDRLQRAGADEILLNALESMPDGFCTIDTNWNFTYINTSLAKIIGENPGDLIGKNLWTSFPEAVNSKFYDSYHDALEKQKSVTVEDFYAPLNVWLEVNVHPMTHGLSLFVKDVSERKKQEQRLRFISKAASEVI